MSNTDEYYELLGYDDLVRMGRWLPIPIQNTVWRLMELDRNFEHPFKHVERIANLRMVHQFFANATHEEAVQAILDRSPGSTGFVLYLRGFAGEAKEKDAPSILREVSEIPEIATFTHNASLQKWVAKVLSKDVPIVCVTNPASIIRTDGMKELSLGNKEWLDVVVNLIDRARAIIVGLGEPSIGLEEELRLILKKQCEGKTVTVFSADRDKTTNLLSRFGRQYGFEERQYDEKEFARWQLQLAQFNHYLEIGKDDSGDELRRTIRDLMIDLRKPASGLTIPPAPGPWRSGISDEMVEQIKEECRRFYRISQVLASKDDFEAAVDALYSGLARSYIGDTKRQRAPLYWELGRVLAIGMKKQSDGVTLLEWAVELYDHLKVSDLARSVEQEIATLLVQMGELEKAYCVLQSAFSRKSFKPDYWVDFCLWNTAYGIEHVRSNKAKAEEARVHALSAYQEYRRNGGAPRQKNAQAIAAYSKLAVIAANSSLEEYAARNEDEFLSFKNSISQMCPRMLKEIGRWSLGEITGDELLDASEGLDEYYELHLMIHIASGRQ